MFDSLALPHPLSRPPALPDQVHSPCAACIYSLTHVAAPRPLNFLIVRRVLRRPSRCGCRGKAVKQSAARGRWGSTQMFRTRRYACMAIYGMSCACFLPRMYSARLMRSADSLASSCSRATEDSRGTSNRRTRGTCCTPSAACQCTAIAFGMSTAHCEGEKMNKISCLYVHQTTAGRNSSPLDVDLSLPPRTRCLSCFEVGAFRAAALSCCCAMVAAGAWLHGTRYRAGVSRSCG